MKLFATALVMSLSAMAAALPSQTCPEIIDRIGLTQIHQMSNREQTDCYITATNINNYVNLFYRDYLVSNDSLLVFHSLGHGPEDTTTGAKEFYFFPRNQRTSKYVVSDDEAQIKIQGRYNFDFIFDAQTSHLVGMSNAKVKVDPKISADNNGGVFITPTKGLVLELQFKLGGAPSADLKKTAIFKDAFGQECSVKVGSIFKLSSDGETSVKYNDAQLKNLLTKICPKIKY